MGVQERRAREKKELRQEILDAARDLFVREGFENVSMRKIAEKIEYSPTTIYLYFQDKADLLDCICEETFEGIASSRYGHKSRNKACMLGACDVTVSVPCPSRSL